MVDQINFDQDSFIHSCYWGRSNQSLLRFLHTGYDDDDLCDKIYNVNMKLIFFVN